MRKFLPEEFTGYSKQRRFTETAPIKFNHKSNERKSSANEVDLMKTDRVATTRNSHRRVMEERPSRNTDRASRETRRSEAGSTRSIMTSAYRGSSKGP